MNQHVQDPFEAAVLRGGYTKEFYERVNAKRKAEAAEREAKEAAERFEEECQEAAKLFRQRGMPEWARDIVLEVCRKRCVSPLAMAGKDRSIRVSQARFEAFYLVRAQRADASFPQIAKWFDRDHSSIVHGVSRHARAAKLPNLKSRPARASRSGAEKARA